LFQKFGFFDPLFCRAHTRDVARRPPTPKG
jgi:hypothetical protein